MSASRYNAARCGGVPEWPKVTGCKPVGSAFRGSNPLSPTSPIAALRQAKGPARGGAFQSGDSGDYPACGRQNALRLGVDDDIREPGVRPPDPLLDVARERMSLGERAARVHPEREEGDEPDLRIQEAKLARLRAGRLDDDPPKGLGLRR